METLGIVLAFIGTIVAAIISAIVTVKTLNKQEDTKLELAEKNAAYKDRVEKGTRNSDAAFKLSESASKIVEKYEVQHTRMEREINELKNEVETLKAQGDKRYDELSTEFVIVKLQLKNAIAVIGEWMEYAMEHNLPIVCIPKTREQIEAEINEGV
jgi:hypothetical protein